MKDLDALKTHFLAYRKTSKFGPNSDWALMWIHLIKLLEQLVKASVAPFPESREDCQEWVTITEFMKLTGLEKINFSMDKISSWCNSNRHLCPNGIKQKEKAAHYYVKPLALIKALSIYPFKSLCERELIHNYAKKYLEENK